MNMAEYFTIINYQIVHNSFILQQRRAIMVPWANAKQTRKSLPQLVYNWEYSVHQLLSNNWKVKTLNQENAVVSIFFFMNHI